MKRISLFLSCLFIAVSVFAGNLHGLLNKVGVVYDYDYVFVTDIAENTVTMEGTLNAEALAVEGLAVKVMVDGKVVGDATINHDTIVYAFDGTYAQGDTIQANLLFKYKAGQTVTSGINYVVAYQTTFNVLVPEGTEGCYLAFVGDSVEKAVEMKTITPTAYTVTVPFNALNKEYYYSLKAEENFYEVDSIDGEAVTHIYAEVGQIDTVQAWNQLCAPYYELIINGKTIMEMEDNAVKNLELQEGVTLQVLEHTKLCKDTITTFVPKKFIDDPIPYKQIDGNLALMQLGGIYDVTFDAETRELEMRRHAGNLLYIYRSYHESDIKAQPYAGFNATAEKVFVDEQNNEYYLKIETADAKAAVAGLVGNAYGVSYMKQVVENPSALVFDYKTTIAGAVTLSIVKTSGDPASAVPVFVYDLGNAKVDDWKSMVIYLDDIMQDKSVLIQENEGDSYYILFNIESKDGLKDGELDVRDMYFAPYIQYNVTVPEGTEICYLKMGEFFYEMEKDASLHYTKTFLDVERHGSTYNYYGGEGDEFIEADAKGEVAKPRFYNAEDVVVAWKDRYCAPKYSFLFEGKKTSFKEVDDAWSIESFEIAQRDSLHMDTLYYIIDDCAGDSLTADTIPLVAGKYKIDLNVNDKKVTFTKLEEPVDPTTLCYDPSEINGAWDDKASNDGTGVLTFTGAWAGIAKWIGEADWSAYEKLELTYTSTIPFNFTIEDGTNKLQSSVAVSDEEKVLVIDDFGSLDLSHITQFWFQSQNDPGTVTVKSVCLYKPLQPTCYDPSEINGAWDDKASNDGTGVLTFTGAWAGIAKWIGEADWSMYNRVVVTYTSDIAFNFAIEDGNNDHKLVLSVPASDTETEFVIDDFGSLDLSHITQFWFQSQNDPGTVTVKSVCVSLNKGPVNPCKTLWEGEVALGNWAAGMQDLAWGGYDWSTVKSDQILTAYFTVDETVGYTNLRFGNGSWVGLPSTIADPASDNEGNYGGFAADATSKSITLSQADIDELVANNGLVVCGAGLVIKGVELCPPAENVPLCLNIIDEAFNALDENASIAEGTMTFKAINSSMIMSLNGLDVSKYNTLTIEYEATTDFQVQLQDAQGEEQFFAEADTNIVVYHYLANVDMKKLLQFIFVADTIGTVKINSLCFSKVEYSTYYLGNKWDGAEEITFREMNTDNHGDWFISGIVGSDNILLAFEAEPKTADTISLKDIPEISGKELLIGDEVEFHCFEFLGNKFAAEVLTRPTYVKHPWESGEWTWVMMTRNEELEQWEYTGIWGGQGFNINAAGPYDKDALWFAANDTNVVYTTTEGEVTVEPVVGTKVTIYYVDNETKAGVCYEAATGLNTIKKGVQVIKIFRNGQFIIRQGEKNFNVLGQEL